MPQIDSLFLLLCTMMVLLMQVGFLLLESGIVRNKNSINVAAKNLIDLSVVILVFWLIGFGVMFGPSYEGLFGTSSFAIESFNTPSYASFFLFQAMFCATATTVISGAIAERGSLYGYIATALMISIIVYPVFGHWAWGGLLDRSQTGWLEDTGFIDFAGSTVVHSIGGWAALAAILIIGPRTGRFGEDAYVFRSHNLVHSVAGTIFLWIGWIGFNTGSHLTFTNNVLGIALNTAIAGAAGGAMATLISVIRLKSMEVTMVCNGVLAGLVSVTASCYAIDMRQAAIIGAIGVCFSTLAFHYLEKMQIDDVVGAVPVHLVAGIWGTIAVAIFGDSAILDTGLSFTDQLMAQLSGILVCAIWGFGATYGLLLVINHFIPLRVPYEAEINGLNIVEHNASNEMHDLIFAMQVQEAESNFSQHVKVEPFTEVSQIATQYNRILDRFNAATQEVVDQHETLKENHDTLKNLQAQMVQSEKMAGLGQLAAGVAHEINNPIGYLISNINTLEQYTSFFGKLIEEYKLFISAHTDKEASEEILQRIDKICREEDLDFALEDSTDLLKESLGGAEKIHEIVKNLKTFCHPGSEAYEMNNIHTIIENTLNVVQNEIKYNSEIIRKFNAESAYINCNASQIGQVLMNLIVNASHAIGQNEKGIIKIITENSGDKLLLHIIDSGCGIKQEALGKIFDPFFTTKEVGKGTGLGLSISHGIMQKHGGDIRVVSKVNTGTKFTLIFPLKNN